MESRSKIISALPDNEFRDLPDIAALYVDYPDAVSTFCETLRSIGGAVIKARTISEANEFVKHQYPDVVVLSAVEDLGTPIVTANRKAHDFENLEVVILDAKFGVAENGAIWISDDSLPLYALPYICQHLIVTLRAGDLVPDMHKAYERIGAADYAFGCFIAGPSKTADIEQSLVLGAQGPKTMTVILLTD